VGDSNDSLSHTLFTRLAHILRRQLYTFAHILRSQLYSQVRVIASWSLYWLVGTHSIHVYATHPEKSAFTHSSAHILTSQLYRQVSVIVNSVATCLFQIHGLFFSLLRSPHLFCSFSLYARARALSAFLTHSLIGRRMQWAAPQSQFVTQLHMQRCTYVCSAAHVCSILI